MSKRKWKTRGDYWDEKKVVHYRAGTSAGPGHVCSNNIEITQTTHVNGSGPTAFNGAHEWPHISVGISFPVDTDQEELTKVIEALKKVIDEVKPN